MLVQSCPLCPPVIRKTKVEVVAALDKLLETHTDQQAADALNRLGYRNWRSESFNAKKVISIRCAYRLKGRRDRLLEQGFIPAEDLARRFAVSVGTIHQWGRVGLLHRQRYDNNLRCLYKPVGFTRIQKGQGGRKPRPPILINARRSKQETV